MPEHLLSAIVAHGNAWRRRLPPASRAELRTLLDHALDSLSTTSAYRDGQTSLAFDSESEGLFVQGLWDVVRGVATDPPILLDRLLALPRIHRLFLLAMRDIGLVPDLVARARAEAASRGHLVIRSEHLLLCLTRDQWLRDVISAVEGGALAPVLDRRLDAVAVVEDAREPSLGEEAAILVAKAGVYANLAHRAPTTDFVLAVAANEDKLSALLVEAEISPSRLRFFLAHGASADASQVHGERAAIVFHDDDFTTQEIVRAILERHLGLAARTARAAMIEVHRSGDGVVATLPAEEARAKVEAIRLAADEQRVPLRVTLRAVTG